MGFGAIVALDIPVAIAGSLGEPFRAAMAFYPPCAPLVEPEAPLLMLIGELDTWTPVDRCERFMMMGGAGRGVVLKIYPGADHGFDLKGTDYRSMGRIARYDAEASRDAYERIRVFLAKHLN